MESVSPVDNEDPPLTGQSHVETVTNTDDEEMSENDCKPFESEVSENENICEPLVKKPRLEKAEVNDVDEEESEDVAASDSERVDNDESGAEAAKKPRLTDDVDKHCDRHRNKSMSAAVLLGLVRSRVRQLATQRRETTAASKSSSAVSVGSLSDAAADSPVTKPSQKMSSSTVSPAHTPKSSRTAAKSDWIKPFDLGEFNVLATCCLSMLRILGFYDCATCQCLLFIDETFVHISTAVKTARKHR